MARGVNKVILIGNLGQDPQLKYTGNGTAVANATMATNDSYKDKQGNLVEKTEWHNLVFWSRNAEIAAEYLRKGSAVYVEGSLQTRTYDDKEGNTRYVTEVKVREFTMLDPKGANGQAPRREPQGQSGFDFSDDYSFDDDLPF